jgi:hypothetical protein
MGKGGGRRVTQTLDPGSQQFVDWMRNVTQEHHARPLDVGAFFNPFMDNLRGEFDMLRGQARTGVAQDATAAGAFGGARHGVAEGVRLGEIDRAQGTMTAQAHQQAVQNAMQHRMMQAQLMNLGLGPTGMIATEREQGDPLGTLFGLGAGFAGLGGISGLLDLFRTG